MDKKYLFIGVAVALIAFAVIVALSNPPSLTATPWTIPNESVQVSSSLVANPSDVYINNTEVAIVVSPAYSDQPIISVQPKTYNGGVDVVFGFNTSDVTPLKAEFNPQTVSVQQSYSCNGANQYFNYTTTPTKHFWCYNNITTYSQTGQNLTNGSYLQPIYDHDFDSGNLTSATAYWSENQTQWNDVSSAFSSLNYQFDGFNKWYYVKGFNVTAGTTYQLRLTLQPKSWTSSEKYFFGIKPSSETLDQAIADGHFYFIDPWTSDLNNGLGAYYKLDETSGGLVDALGLYNGTNNGVVLGGAGIVNNSYNFTGTYPSYTNSSFHTSTNTWTIAGWFNTNQSGGQTDIIADDAGGGGWAILKASNQSLFYYTQGGTAPSNTYTNISVNDGKWHLFIAIGNSTGKYLYMDNTLYVAQTGTVTAPAQTYNMTFGKYPNGQNENYQGLLDEVGFWNVSLNDTQRSTLWNSGAGTTYPVGGSSVPSTISLNSPANASNVSIHGVTLNWTISNTTYAVSNTTLFVNGALNQTNTSGLNGSYAYAFTLADGNYNWSVGTINSHGDITNSTNYTFTVNTTIGGITVLQISPVNNSALTNTTVNFNATSTVTTGNLTNNTVYVWYNNGTLFSSGSSVLTGNDTTGSGYTNSSGFSFSNFTVGSYLWNYYSCGTNIVGDKATCSYGANNFTLNIGTQTISKSFNATTYETKNETYAINVTAFNNTITNPILQWNGTNYTAVATNIGGSNYTINASINDIAPTGANTSAYWNFTWTNGGIQETSNNTLVYVNQTNFTFCNSGQYITFFFKDETNSTSLNGDIPSSSFNYWLGGGSQTKSYSYTNTTANSNFSFCFSPPTNNVTSIYNISYAATGYPQRTFTPTSNSFLTNSSTNQTLYLLSSVSGQYVTFQVVNTGSTSIQGVYVNATETIAGTPYLVGSGYTGADGGITFWLNPNNQHTITFTKAGYTSYTTTITPTQSSYTIVLGAVSSSSLTDYTQGIIYSIQPTLGTTLSPNTSYNFNFTMNSTYWSLDSFGFNLLGQNGTILGSNSTSGSNTGTVIIWANTSNYTHITVQYYWVINGTYSNGSSGGYDVYDFTTGNGYSIFNFFQDFKTYAGYPSCSTTGIFGLDCASMDIFLLFFIIITTGMASYKFSLVRPDVISGIVFAQVFIFDVGLGLITLPVKSAYFAQAVHTPTLLVGLITLYFIFRENI